MRLTAEQIQQILEGAIETIMQREGCDRETAMDALERNGVRVQVTRGNETEMLYLRLGEKEAPFVAND